MRKFLSSVALTGGLIAAQAAMAQTNTPVQIKASDAAANRFFGYSVALSADTLVTGSPLANAGLANDGNAYVYRWNGTTWSQEQRLLGPSANGGTSTDFGRSVAISGDTLVVGARADDPPAGADAGAAYVYTRTAGVWTLQQQLTASNGAAADFFGDTVAIDGDTIVCSAPAKSTNQGSLYVFVRNGSVWTQQGAPLTASGAANGDKLGQAGALSISGDTIAAGAADRAGGGKVFLFQRQITQVAPWTESIALISPDAGTDPTGRFGSSVSILGDSLAVGANAAPNGGTARGKAFIFRRVGGTWSTAGLKITPADATDGDNFGNAIAMGVDSVLVGATGRNANTGAAFAFRFRDGAWSLESSLTAPDAATGDNFGWSVAFDSGIAVVAAESDDLVGPPVVTDAGSAWIFSRDNGRWLGSESAPSVSPAAAANDKNGVCVAMDGNYAISGAFGATDNGAANAGVAYIWNRNATLGWSQQQKILSGSAQVGQAFGRGVTISGDTVVIGAPYRDAVGIPDQGGVFFFKRNGSTWNADSTSPNGGVNGFLTTGSASDYFGQSVAISGDTAIVGAYGYDGVGFTNSGAAHLIIKNANNTWQINARLEANDKATNDYFGYAVALNGDTAVIGAYNKNSGVGAAYVFQRDGSSFRQTQKLTAQDAAFGDFFGISVAIEGDVIAVGAYGKSVNGNAGQGAAYVFARQAPSQTFNQVARLVANDGQPADSFGIAVGVSGRSVVVGSYLDKLANTNNVGSVYVFTSISGDATGPWVGETNKFVASGAPIQDAYFGYGAAMSGTSIIAGAFNSTSAQGRVYFYDFTDATQVGIANMTAQQTVTNFTDAMANATAGQQIAATAGAFNTASLNYNGKGIFVRSRTSIAENNLSQISLANGATLNAGAGYPMNLYGTVRTANDSGRSDLTAATIRQGGLGSLFVGEHEISFNSSSITMDGRTSLESAKSAISSTGLISFKGNVTDLFGGRINSAGGIGFDGVVNLRNTVVSSGAPVTVSTYANMSNVSLAASAINVTGGGKLAFGGTILGPVNNTGSIIFAAASSIYGSVTSNANAVINVSDGGAASTKMYGTLTNNGTLTGSFGGCTTCLGIPTGFRIDNDLSLGSGAGLSMTGAALEIGGSLDSTLIDPIGFRMLEGAIRFSTSGQGVSTLEVMSHDFGPAGAAMKYDIDGSFPIGTLEVGPISTTVTLVNKHANSVLSGNPKEALYIETLIVDHGSRFNTSGYKVYARYSNISGTVDNPANIITLGGPCDADLRIDAFVDDGDFSLFVSAYDVAICSDSAMPRLGGGSCRADLNGDGVVDDADFQIFVAAYDQLVCD